MADTIFSIGQPGVGVPAGSPVRQLTELVVGTTPGSHVVQLIMAFGHLSPLIICAAVAAHNSAWAGVVADETMVIDFLQTISMNTHVTTSIEGNKARREFTVRMKDEETHSTEIHRLDRGVVYSLNEASREYGESRLAGAAAMDSSRQIASIAAALKCQWAAVVMKKTEAGAAQVRIDVSHRCKPTVPAGPSCTLGITYDQWSTRPNELHAELARYRREYAAKAGTETGIAEEFLMFSQFGVPVDPVLLESIRKATAKE